ncbi:MAG: tRNA (guanosine(37)-N1)-methyltransferase TrmD [Actinomycetaceae bacterium]|nr:tRNA (guanosine(37)-N1)-methyltransferase TrmD [Actinomycetaceae bacterium]
MRFDFISIFPQYFNALELSLMGKAVQKGQLSINVHDLRDWTEDKHRSVDDAPYGGGAGMVMRADIWGKALDQVVASSGRRILAVPTPSGVPLTQEMARSLVDAEQIIFACGRYEGIDYRVVEHYREDTEVEVLEYSIGDYVLNGGEVAALVLVEAVARLLDGFMSNPESLVEESFENNLLEYPAYTRPLQWQGREVPEVLRTGNHGAIEQWRREISLMRTATRRPDLVRALDPKQLSESDFDTLAYYGWTYDAQLGWLELDFLLGEAQLLAVDETERTLGQLQWSKEPTCKLPKALRELQPLVLEDFTAAQGHLLAGMLRHLAEFKLATHLVACVDSGNKELVKVLRGAGFVKSGRISQDLGETKRFLQVLVLAQ